MNVHSAVARPFTNARLRAFLELTKPRVTWLVVLTAGIGFHLGSPFTLGSPLPMFHALLGVALLSGGAAALNQYLERESDGRMQRTSSRPLPSGRLTGGEAAVWGGMLTVAGGLYLALFSNLLSAGLGWLTVLVYVFLYTPMKMKTPLCTAVGAFPGAMPPLIGWAAAAGQLDGQALLLFAILFIWQFPHFLAIAWIYREDYRRGGCAMLPALDQDGSRTSRRILSSTILLLLLSLVPPTMGLAGLLYLAGALLLGGVFVWYGIQAVRYRSTTAARHVLRVSVAYLPLLLFLLVIDRT